MNNNDIHPVRRGIFTKLVMGWDLTAEEQAEWDAHMESLERFIQTRHASPGISDPSVPKATD